MATTIFELLGAGAKAVVGVHHSPKGAAKQEPDLENTLRGSGDLGAMADAVYNLKSEDHQRALVRVKNVKARDFEPVPPFEIQGRPFINETCRTSDFWRISRNRSSQSKIRKDGRSSWKLSARTPTRLMRRFKNSSAFLP